MPKATVSNPIQSVLNLLEYEAQKKRVGLAFKCKGQLPEICADPDGIQQLVLNLVTNALAATPPKGCIEIAVDTALYSPGGVHGSETPALRLSVKDNGCGMSPEVLNRLFEPFFTTRHEQGGVGLGLAVARSIVTAHGGEIKAESGLGQGSVITVLLPLSGEPNA
jgi:signal transduction histidine kinase